MLPLQHTGPFMALRHRCRIEVRRIRVGFVVLWTARATTLGSRWVVGRQRSFFSRSRIVAEVRAQNWCMGQWSEAKPLLWIGPGQISGISTRYEYYLDLTRLVVDDEGEPLDGPDDGPRIQYEDRHGNRADQPEQERGMGG